MHEHELKLNAVAKGQVLFVCTSNSKLGDTDQKTGAWIGEIAAPYFIFKEAGYDVTIASVQGGEVPLDENSLKAEEPPSKRMLGDDEAMLQLKQSVPLERVHDPLAYDAIFLPGGHGVMWDLPDNQKLQDILRKAHEGGKIISAVCHGPAGLVNAKDSSGKHIVSGKQVFCFSDAEEAEVQKQDVIPWSLEAKMREAGAQVIGGKKWEVHAVRDGNLITGQNPQSAARVAELVVEDLDKVVASKAHA